ncbi:MAG: GNAT family N-acetyltransferase [Methylobacteriaceae bacterium]|nr:GNAT family N-acetyltransferase [Methylobacteriaceae bacterium]
MSTITIRPLARTDRAQWQPLWQGYLAFYKTRVPDEVTETTFARFFDEAEPMHAFVAERDGEIVGIVHYIFHRSTWTKGPYCYLQDLFTAEHARGHGVGRKLIEAVYERAKAEGASRVYWLTQEDNATARALYDKLADRPGFIQYRKIF